jgi:hypothetical protein
MIKVLASDSQGRSADVDLGIAELRQAVLEFEHLGFPKLKTGQAQIPSAGEEHGTCGHVVHAGSRDPP